MGVQVCGGGIGALLEQEGDIAVEVDVDRDSDFAELGGGHCWNGIYLCSERVADNGGDCSAGDVGEATGTEEIFEDIDLWREYVKVS